MDQLWCHIHTVTVEPMSGPRIKVIRQLLGILHSHGVDWTDLSAWPEDYVDGHWERQIPIPFLLMHYKPGINKNLRVVQVFCEGTTTLTALMSHLDPPPPDLCLTSQVAPNVPACASCSCCAYLLCLAFLTCSLPQVEHISLTKRPGRSGVTHEALRLCCSSGMAEV